MFYATQKKDMWSYYNFTIIYFYIVLDFQLYIVLIFFFTTLIENY